MNVSSVLNTCKKFVKKNKSLILTVSIMVSMTASLYSVGKTAIEVEHILDSNAPKKVKRRKIIKKSFVPASIVAVTYILVVYSYVTNKKVQMSLLMAAASSQQMLENYRKNVQEEIGNEKEEDVYASTVEEMSVVPKTLSPNKKLFCEPISKQFFESTVEDVVLAEYELNRLFRLRGEVSFTDWLVLLGIETKPEADEFGWSELGEPTYGYSWVDFEHRLRQTRDGREFFMIEYPFLPHYDYLDPYDETCGDNVVFPSYKV